MNANGNVIYTSGSSMEQQSTQPEVQTRSGFDPFQAPSVGNDLLHPFYVYSPSGINAIKFNFAAIYIIV